MIGDERKGRSMEETESWSSIAKDGAEGRKETTPTSMPISKEELIIVGSPSNAAHPWGVLPKGMMRGPAACKEKKRWGSKGTTVDVPTTSYLISAIASQFRQDPRTVFGADCR